MKFERRGKKSTRHEGSQGDISGKVTLWSQTAALKLCPKQETACASVSQR